MPRPPACASINDVPTGVPCDNPNSAAAFADNPGSIASPGTLTSLPQYLTFLLKYFFIEHFLLKYSFLLK